MLDCTDNTLT